MGTSTLSATDFIKHATGTAHHFGFRELGELRDDERCRNGEKSDQPKIPAAQKRTDSLHGLLASGAISYFDHGLQHLGEPALFYTIEETPRNGDVALSLQILGVDKSIAEALLIHTIRSLYRDLSYSEHVVRVNSLGDRESMTRYTRELGNYLRKRIELLPPTARELMKEHVLVALQHLLEKEHEIGLKSPSSLEYLNESSRRHFREIIEYLDFSETPYEIDTRLLGHHQCYSQTMFSVDAFADSARTDAAPFEARGGRYDEFISFNTKKNVPAVGAVVTLRERKFPARVPRQKATTPQIFIVQLGFGPKLRTLSILDDLKRADIPVYQSLASDSLSAQLENARRRGVPYTLILGQKEYADGNIILRDMFSSSQESVPIHNLVSHLRRTILA